MITPTSATSSDNGMSYAVKHMWMLIRRLVGLYVYTYALRAAERKLKGFFDEGKARLGVANATVLTHQANITGVLKEQGKLDEVLMLFR